MRLLTVTFATMTVLTAACTHAPEAPPPAPVEAAVPPPEVVETVEETPEIELTERERVQLAIQLLGEGDETQAALELATILGDRPSHATALKLLEQIEADPVALLGEDHTEHEVEPGETMSSLAKTHLGDPLLFYVLARYNGLEAPNRLMAGQTLKVPQRATAQVTEEPAAPPPVEVAAAEPAEAPEQPGVAAAASPAKVAAANMLRLQALEQLNAGKTARALELLRRAKSLDANNPNIAADLEKVERIQAALSQSDRSEQTAPGPVAATGETEVNQ